MWSQNYLDSRLKTFNYKAGTLNAINSYYLGTDNQMTYLGNLYPVAALSQLGSMWVFDTSISNQIGTLAGVFYL